MMTSLLLSPIFFLFLLETKMGDGNKIVVVTFFSYVVVANKAIVVSLLLSPFFFLFAWNK
jgi:hypothetical protein